MSHTIVNDEGEEEVVYTEAEKQAEKDAEIEKVKADYEAKLAEKDAHVKEKLDQFQQAKKGVDTAQEEVRAMAEEAKRLAEEAKMSVAQAKEAELTTKKDFYIQSVVGGDTDLRKKIEDAYGMLNLPAATDKEIMERVQKAVTLAGISQMSTPSLSFGGAQAPNFQQAGEQTKEAAYNEWKKELGINL